ncbi:MAG: hypothetical protein WB611_03960 [Stellaceae bacterium]
MNLDLTGREAAALARHLRQALDYEPYPFAPRLNPLKAILARLDPPTPKPEPPTPRSSSPLGNAAAARVRFIVWCRDCQHRVEPDPAEMEELLRHRDRAGLAT